MTELGVSRFFGGGAVFWGQGGASAAGSAVGWAFVAERLAAAWRASVEHPGEAKAGLGEPASFRHECWHGPLPGWPTSATGGVERFAAADC